MTKITNSIYEIRYLDEASQKNSVVHRINPLIKLIITIMYIVSTVSYGKYEIGAMIPLVIYPVIIFNMGDIPLIPVLKRSLLVLPIVLGLGIFNPIIDKEPFIAFSNFYISAGWISYISLIMKSMLSVIAAMLLISTTSIDKLSGAMQRLHVPKVLIMIFLMTYRYIYVLMEEFSSIYTAYALRAPGQKGIHHKLWGPLLGQLLMRTYDRAQMIYSAMILRGYSNNYNKVSDPLRFRDFIYLILWIVFILLSRFCNIPVLIGNIFTGAFR